jgi:glycine hydroxymethyltransferase
MQGHGQTPLAQADPEIYKLLEEEKRRQVGGLELIASEVRVRHSVIAARSWFFHF